MKKDYRNRRDSGPAIRGAKVTVRNGDVNGALRTLKKILDRDNRQKELAKREFYEKQVPKSGFRVQHRQKPASRPKSGSTPKENGNG